MAPQLSLARGYIVSLWLETLFYGFYLCLFCVSLYVQVSMSKSQNIHGRIMFGVGILMFIIATVHISVNSYRTIYGYVDAPDGAVAFLGILQSWHSILTATLYATQSIMGDAVAVYRCWVIWARNYRLAALPFALLIVSIISGYMVSAFLAMGRTGETIFNERLNRWIKVFYAVAVIQNTMTTSLTAYRLWSVERASGEYRVHGGSFLPVVRILIESAALYLAAEIVLLAVYCAGSFAQYIIIDSIPPIVGITFSAIAIRVTWRSHEDHLLRTTNSKASTEFRATVGHIPMQRIAVTITQDVEDDGFSDTNAEQMKVDDRV